MDTNHKTEFWNSLIRAVEAEPKIVQTLQGKSGLIHPIIALGIDDSRNRVIIISGEPNPRVAAMAQYDIQASMPATQVIMARPAPINLGGIAKLVTDVLGRTTITLDTKKNPWFQKGEEEFKAEMDKFLSIYGDTIQQLAFAPFHVASLNPVAAWQEIIQQLSFIELNTNGVFEDKPKKKKPYRQKPRKKKHKVKIRIPEIGLASLASLNPAELDRSYGICSIPLYEFTQAEVELMHSGKEIDYIRAILRKHDIFQYFFPPADELALGLAEITPSSKKNIVEQLSQVPTLGHPFGAMEILNEEQILIPDIIDALKAKGLMVEGELGIELTEEGKSIRSTISYKPKEGLLQKLSRVFSVKVDLSLSDLFKP